MKRYVKHPKSPPCRTKAEKKAYDRWYYRHVTCRGK